MATEQARVDIAPEKSVSTRYVLGLAIAAVLALALIPSRGHYRADAMALIFVALGLVLAQVSGLFRGFPGKRVPQRWVVPVLFALLASFLFIRIVDEVLLTLARESMWRLRALAAVQLLLLGTYARPIDARIVAWRKLRFALVGLSVVLAGLETVRLVPDPLIDVFDVQMRGAEALLRGQNPFEVVRVHDTAPGVVSAAVPYVYPPLHVLLTLPAVLLGDARYTMVACLFVFGVSVRSIGVRGLDAHPLVVDAPALLIWFSPKLLYITQQAWIDPVQVALIATAVALFVHGRRRGCAAVLGLALASKQSMFWLAPLAVFQLGWGPVEIGIFALVALLPTLPFALWNLDALRHANFGFLKSLPERNDALSFVVWAKHALGISVRPITGFVLAALVVLGSVWRRRSVAWFGLALFVTYFFFFTFNKWTFANYYFTLASFSALVSALALSSQDGASSLSGSRRESHQAG